uniref:Nascent polypeptide-associated complex protein n=1 Tax=Candidatus Methanophagaceae archaeon ANME-1 ERB6 TaxID=2759912 RepID=A0A7G9Z0B0_9EURY|nr:nascent polypeptide-associated complex protein [Methanosarcinales archaeon ANME-1 ERB6]
MRGGFRKGVSLSPKKLDQMMKQVGLSVEEMNDVEEVVIKTADAELVFEDATVTIMDAQGSKMYQITGTPVKRPKRELEPEQEQEVSISAEDVEIVMEKAGCGAEEAKATLIETRGDLAEAISRLCEE